MDHCDKQSRVYELARAFRAAILAIPHEDRLLALRDFTHGSCGDASILLGEYLSDMGAGDWDYISGERTSYGHSHAWLIQGDLVVDIAADQFRDGQPVVVP